MGGGGEVGEEGQGEEQGAGLGISIAQQLFLHIARFDFGADSPNFVCSGLFQ